MTTATSRLSTTISRRGILKQGTLIAGAGLVGGGVLIAAPAAAKVSQKGVSYQATPKGSARCDKCGLWQPPAACKSVDGAISPSGWCTLYTPK